jgi:hypothetical protein
VFFIYYVFGCRPLLCVIYMCPHRPSVVVSAPNFPIKAITKETRSTVLGIPTNVGMAGPRNNRYGRLSKLPTMPLDILFEVRIMSCLDGFTTSDRLRRSLVTSILPNCFCLLAWPKVSVIFCCPVELRFCGTHALNSVVLLRFRWIRLPPRGPICCSAVPTVTWVT